MMFSDRLTRRHISPAVAAVVLCATVAAAAVHGRDDEQDVTIAPPIELTAAADSIATDSIQGPTEGEILTETAAQKYKDVKFMEYDGEIESVLYNAALDATTAAANALAKSDNDTLAERNVSMLLDLNPLLLRGAVYYSSQNDKDALGRFARAYIDVQLLPQTAGQQFERDKDIFPVLAYNAAYAAYNEDDVEHAKDYFALYLDSGDTRLRENVFAYFGQACLQTGDYMRGYTELYKGVQEFPGNARLTMLALQCCVDGGYVDLQQPLLDRALILNPGDERLLNLQAKVYEAAGNYHDALTLYQQIAEAHPNSIENTRRIATCQYNLGASYYNNSIMESDEKAASRYRRQSKAYFASAKETLERILNTTPSDMKYLTAAARTYAALGLRDLFDGANTRIAALGGKRLTFNDMPDMMSSAATSSGGASRFESVKVPDYESFARPYIEEHLGEWALRGEFETIEDYARRMKDGEATDIYDRLSAEAADEYLKRYARQLTLTDMKRSDYDVDNQTYRIDTPYGPTVVKVPLKGSEAEAFKAGWEAAQIRAPRFIIRDNKVALAEITYVVNGRRYTYSAADAATYAPPKVYVDVNSILVAAQAGKTGQTTDTSDEVIVWSESDVDVDIPVTTRRAGNVFALIIANEKYDKASDVYGAMHDGHTIAQYCIKTLGIPESNIISLNNATKNRILDAISTIGRRVKGTGPESEVIFYYAGHGLPDDATKEAFMMPSDANPANTETLVSMNYIYDTLGSMDASAVQVFLDACFSGESRDRQALVESRGVALKAKDVSPRGNMFVLSAASAQETAMPYKEKHHGLFTYFLLKKLQESKGNATLKEISDYVIRNVRDTSNSNPGILKEQNPTVSTSGNMTTMWTKKKLK